MRGMKRVAWQAAVATVMVSTSLGAQAPEFETTRIAGGVYQFRWRAHNGFFVVTDAGVIAFDPISLEAAQRYASEVQRVAPGKKLLAVVYSHDHPDHASGADVLRRELGPDAPVVAHANARARVIETASPDLPPPDVTFTDRLTLYFGGRRVELRFLGKSHSDNLIIALVPDVKVAFAVDFVANDRVGYRELSSNVFPDFFDAVERLQELEFETIVFGHGPPGDRASVERQGRYYSALRAAVAAAIDEGWTEDEAAEKITLPQYSDWGGYDTWFALNVRGMYRWLVKREP